jgi:NADH-quinone oxidoreductase subunit H
MSAIIVTLFLGGPQPPFHWHPAGAQWLWGVFWFFAKLFIFLFGYVWLRATLPRLRYDQLMDLGWKVLIPTAFGWLLLIASMRVARDRGWNTALTAVIGVVVLAACWGLLARAFRVSGKRRELEGTVF